jgi:hypothetical protein
MRWLLLTIPIVSGCCYDNCLLHGDWSIGLRHEAGDCGCQPGGPHGAGMDDGSWPGDAQSVSGKFHPVPTRPVFEPPTYAPEAAEEVPAELPGVAVPRTSQTGNTPERGRRRPVRSVYSQNSTSADTEDAAYEADVEADAVIAATPHDRSGSIVKDSAWVRASYEEPINELIEEPEFVVATKPALEPVADVSPRDEGQEPAPPTTGWRPSRRASTAVPVDSPPI